MSDRTVIGRSSELAHEPIAWHIIVGNKVFVDCSSELDGQTKERCLSARGRDIRLSLLIENRGLFGGLAAVSWTPGV